MGKKSIVITSAAIAALALLVAACGGASNSTPGVASTGGTKSQSGAQAASSGRPTLADALAASHCMRTHGVPNFPDPINGRFGFTVDSGVDSHTPQFKTALKYCADRYLRWGQQTSSPAQQAQENEAAVKFSACMRSHGASDFPDPDGTGEINLPSSTYLSAPAVQHAESACKSLRSGGIAFAVPVP